MSNATLYRRGGASRSLAASSGAPRLQGIKTNPRWAYQPDALTNLADMRKNPIPFVGVGRDRELAEKFDGYDTVQTKFVSNTSIEISKLKTLQPFVLNSGVTNYRSWDQSQRPYVVEYKGNYYLIDGNHRAAKAKLDGKKTINVDISHLEDAKK